MKSVTTFVILGYLNAVPLNCLLQFTFTRVNSPEALISPLAFAYLLVLASLARFAGGTPEKDDKITFFPLSNLNDDKSTFSFFSSPAKSAMISLLYHCITVPHVRFNTRSNQLPTQFLFGLFDTQVSKVDRGIPSLSLARYTLPLKMRLCSSIKIA